MINEYTPVITAAHHTHCDPDWYWKNPQLQADSMLLWIVLGGRAVLEAKDEVRNLRRGDCYLMRMRDHYLGLHDTAYPLHVQWAVFHLTDTRGRVVPLSYDLDVNLPALYRKLEDLRFSEEMFERAIDSHIQGNSRLASKWLELLLDDIGAQAVSPRTDVPPEQLEVINEFCQNLQDTPERPWRVEDIADKFGYSSDHFSRLFKKVVGQTPSCYIISARIERAKSLLRMSSQSISQIAHALGYGDVYHFSRQFKQKTGLTPSGYRKHA